MPCFRSVPPLQQLGLVAVGDMVVAMAPSILAQVDPNHDPQRSLQRALDRVQALLVSHVPRYVYDDMAGHVLQAVKGLIEQTKKAYYPQISMSAFMTQMNVVVSLTETVLSEHLRTIDFSRWPKIMRYVLYKCLHKMSGLEVLNLGSCTGGWRTEEYDKSLITGISSMRNLHSLCLCFDCTDHIIHIISDTCLNLHTLDITSSRSVTDRSVPSLLRCLHLRELLLLRTSISAQGLAQILVGLPELRDIGRCDDFGQVLEFIQELGGCQLDIRRIHMKDLSTENLRLLVEMCPRIENVSLFRDEHFSDLTVLTHLENLSDLKLLSCDFYTNCMKQLLEIRGFNLTSLHLEHVEEIDGRALIYVSKSCPFLRSLILYNCDFQDENSSSYVGFSCYSKNKPFQHLERLFWVVDCALVHLEFILANATNIKSIHLGSSTGITHVSMENTLKVNPMRCLEELRILYSSDLSIVTVQLLLESCPVLKVMSELESWAGITWEELAIFREYISSNNFDLDIRPTLSY